MSSDSRPVVAIVTNLERDLNYPFPGYPRAMLNEDYPRSVAAAGGVPILLPPMRDVSLLSRQLDAAGALLLAGGQDVDPLLYDQSPLVGTQMPSPIRDVYEYEALRLAFERNLPILAICRGVQLLNVFLGGTLHQDLERAGTNLRHVGTDEPEAGAHRVAIAADSTLAGVLGRTEATVNSFHHQAIDRVADGLRVVATAPDGIVEAVEFPGRPLLGVQWHPEMMSRTSADAQAIFRWFVGLASRRPVSGRQVSEDGSSGTSTDAAIR